MSVETVKLRTRIDHLDDPCELKRIARDLITTIELLTSSASGPESYRVICMGYGNTPFVATRGTKDFCSGYVKARGDGKVYCGAFECSPEWGAISEDLPE